MSTTGGVHADVEGAAPTRRAASTAAPCPLPPGPWLAEWPLAGGSLVKASLVTRELRARPALDPPASAWSLDLTSPLTGAAVLGALASSPASGVLTWVRARVRVRKLGGWG